MSKVTNSTLLSKQKTGNFYSPTRKYYLKPYECTPLGQAFRESVSSLIKNHGPAPISQTLSNLLIWGVGNSFELDSLPSSEEIVVINQFYSKIKYLIWNIESIELNEDAATDNAYNADLETYFALIDFLAFLATSNCPTDKLRLIVDLIGIFNNYHMRANEIEIDRMQELKPVA